MGHFLLFETTNNIEVTVSPGDGNGMVTGRHNAIAIVTGYNFMTYHEIISNLKMQL
jgi:hypothetical protein